jgi:hypothetical protein
MSLLTRILSGIALAGAFSIPAFADNGPPMPNGSMLIVWPDGSVARVHVLDSSADSVMQQAQQTTQPTILIVEHGHAFLVPDRQMNDGKMMSDDMSNAPQSGATNDNQSSGAAQSSGTAKQ